MKMILRTSGWNQAPIRPEWPDGEVHVWRATLQSPVDSTGGLQHSLSSDERERLERFCFERDRRRYLIGRGLLRTLLGCYLDMAPDQVRFDYTSLGKPHLASCSA